MGNVTEEKWIEMLEKKADGNYIAKYPKVKSKSGVTFDEHLADIATQDGYGHIRLQDIKTTIKDETTGDEYKWGIENGLVYLERVVE